MCYTLGMAITLLTICLVYLLAWRSIDRRTYIDRRIEQYKQDVGCYLLES